ncbi:MAG: hypothetical protein ACLP0A_12160 [Verrucomicrobiia bacterium]
MLGGGISTVSGLLLPILVATGGVTDDAGNEVTLDSISVGTWLFFFLGLFLMGIPTVIRYLFRCYLRSRALNKRGDPLVQHNWLSCVETDSLIGNWLAGAIGTLFLVLITMAVQRFVLRVRGY